MKWEVSHVKPFFKLLSNFVKPYIKLIKPYIKLELGIEALATCCQVYMFRVIAAMSMPPAELVLSIYPQDPTTLMKLCTTLFGVLLDFDTLLIVVVDDYT